MNKQNVINFINNHSLVGVKTGMDRQSFLDIWMVIVENRIFARSWGLAEKSWYNSFLENPKGQIKCDETIYDVRAFVPNSNL